MCHAFGEGYWNAGRMSRQCLRVRKYRSAGNALNRSPPMIVSFCLATWRLGGLSFPEKPDEPHSSAYSGLCPEGIEVGRPPGRGTRRSPSAADCHVRDHSRGGDHVPGTTGHPECPGTDQAEPFLAALARASHAVGRLDRADLLVDGRGGCAGRAHHVYARQVCEGGLRIRFRQFATADSAKSWPSSASSDSIRGAPQVGFS